jgi:hypothetical protein
MFKEPAQPSTIPVRYETVVCGHTFPTHYTVSDAISFGPHNNSVRQALCVVTVDIMRLHVSTSLTVLTALEAMHQMTKRVHLSKISIKELRAKEGLSFLEARKKFLESLTNDRELIICIGSLPLGRK